MFAFFGNIPKQQEEIYIILFRLKNLFQKYNKIKRKDQIKYKAEQKETWCFLSILPETTEYLEQISNALKQYGYQV